MESFQSLQSKVETQTFLIGFSLDHMIWLVCISIILPDSHLTNKRNWIQIEIVWNVICSVQWKIAGVL